MMSLEQFIAQRWNSLPETTTISENSNGCFDCNICLDFAQEPVVTLCGHLYCWPCIYKWLQIASNSNENSQCPVCKADISSTTMIPLYGRGQNLVEADPGSKDCCKSTAIPPRPPALGTQALISSAPHRGQQQLYGNPNQTEHQTSNLFHEGDSSLQFLNLGGASVSQFQNPVMGMFGEMVYARVFGDPVNLLAHPHMLPNVGTSPRARRQELQVEKSLSRISIFLFCCFLLCLIVF